MKFEFTLYRPGIADFNKKTGEPYAFAPETTEFEASSNTGALNIARKLYDQTGLGRTAHFNVSRV